jgi:predicted ATPase
MRFSRIRLENWRNFGDVDVALQNRVFIVGPNASGKSNLLDVFRFLRDLVTPGGGFQEAVLKRGGVSILRNLAARGNRTSIVIDTELSEDDEALWRYRLVFNQAFNLPTLREEKIWRRGELVLDRPDNEDRDDSARLTQTYLEQTFANREYREITDFYKSINYSHIVPQLVRDPERSIGRQLDPYGGDFLEQIAATNKRSRTTQLNRIQNALEIAVPQLTDLVVDKDEKGFPHLRAKYKHWRPDGAWQKETEFSDGTLRLIGLLWALQVGSGPLLLEEPELSLHPGVVRHLPQMMLRIQRLQKKAPRQLIISTHSSDLLTDAGIAPDEVLLLLPSKEGTIVEISASDSDIVNELNSGFSIAEAVLPRTEPQDIQQLSLFSE